MRRSASGRRGLGERGLAIDLGRDLLVDRLIDDPVGFASASRISTTAVFDDGTSRGCAGSVGDGMDSMRGVELILPRRADRA